MSSMGRKRANSATPIMSLPRSVCSTPSEPEPVRRRPALSETSCITAEHARRMATSPVRCMPCVLDQVSSSSVAASAPARHRPRSSGTSGRMARMAARSSSGRATLFRRPDSTSSTLLCSIVPRATGQSTPLSTLALPAAARTSSASHSAMACPCRGSDRMRRGAAGRSSGVSGVNVPRRATGVAQPRTSRESSHDSSGDRRCGGAADGSGLAMISAPGLVLDADVRPVPRDRRAGLFLHPQASSLFLILRRC
eukprot:scaffold32716_cov129-Isochrysis_galbana.AAC.1